MYKMQNISALLLCVSALFACASSEPPDRQSAPGIEEIKRALGCSLDEIAVCVDVNCEPDDYVCADKASVQDLLRPAEYR